MPRLLLVTFQLLPAGEPGGDDLVRALAARGIGAEWVVWDDPSVDWAGADAVAVRSAWDYHRRLEEFLDWAAGVEKSTTLLNGADLFRWNADKAYLRELGRQVPVVPSELLDDTDLVGGLRAALERWGTVVVKPRVGAGGVGVVVAEATDDQRLDALTPGPWLVQPMVESIRTEGERSIFVLGGRAVSEVDKTTGTDIRVNESYGGRSTAVPLDGALGALAEAAVAAAAAITGRTAAYARVDLVRWQGDWVVSELELIEPGLYLDVDPANAGRFAALAVRELTGLSFRSAGAADVDELVGLIESAYRGDASRVGWTTEADLLHGQRTDPEGVRAVIEGPASRMLVAERDGGIVACCQLERRDDAARTAAYFGMFAVRPGMQGGGLGTVVMAEAERIAREEWGATVMAMTVISARAELIAYYERRGYRRTGETRPFPYGDERFGVPQRDDLEFVVLVKPLV